MQSSRFQSITARFSPHNLRTSFRRSMSSSSTSSRASSTDRASFASETSSPVSTINSIVFRRKSELERHDEDERAPHILEPRPAATFCSLEERMMSF
ncbi:hypothetical protein NEMBOFW57_002326 [Staphylotrichum longicolle]|uniref:Uncharacterized protein n=1 Tax=Staphylotrichum longicolle TaxID=669026 RepID=A0AAD4I2E2_9PEZI|nr:hypothetical protein NEMBOFW57_002326 [Staphylotrichum longicolle]